MPDRSDGRWPRPVLLLLGVVLLSPVSVPRCDEEEGGSEVALEIVLVDSRSAAEEVLLQIKAGEAFETLARRHSIDPTAPEGGYLGKLRVSALRPEIQEAIKGLSTGQVSGVIETPSGYMLVKVLREDQRVDIESLERSRKFAMAALGKVQMVTDVSGLGMIENFFARLAKPPNWNQELQTICEMRRRAVDIAFDQIQTFVRESDLHEPDRRNPVGLVNAHDALARLWAYQGNMDKALEHFQAAYEIARMASATGAKEAQLDLLEKIGIVYMMQGELDNSVKDAQVRACLFPVDPAARYKVASNSKRAIQVFSEYLRQDPSDLEVKWLLNLAYMTLGEYPDDVPKEHLLPPTAFESQEDFGRFVDVAPALGLNTFSMSGGVIVDDFDNDGFLEVVTSSLDPCVPMHYFHNNGDGTFTDRTSQAGLSDQLGGLNILQADYNNDGCLDILVLRGAWSLPMRKSLLRGSCDGTFTDVTRESGLAIPPTSTQTAAWADINNDGFVDLFVGNEFSPSQVFLNERDGTFVDVAQKAGVGRTAFTKGVAAGDYDNDGYPDFYVSNRGDNFLYHNNRDGTFTDVARPLRVETPILSFPVWFFDFDNDGWLDLFVPSYYQSDVEVVRSYLNLPVKAEALRLYRNTGGGSFQDVSKDVGLDRVFMPMGCNFGDVDNDGFLDFYLGTGAPSYGAMVPNVLFRNKEGKRFVDVTTFSGTGCLHKGHGVAFADLNNDGHEEILIEEGGAVPGDRHAMLVFRNPGNDNNWINVRLVGVKTNRAAIGARIKVTLESAGHDGRRFIHRVVGSGGSFGASPLQQHIGLGKATRIESLEIWWPTSNTRQVFRNVGVNQFIEVKEFEKDFMKLNRRSFVLGEKTRTRVAAGRAQ